MSSDTTVPASEGPTAPAPVPLNEPVDGVPLVIETERGLARAAAAIAAGEGPVAVDAERASGYRYGQRAYLVQLRREGAGTWLIDPVALPRPRPARRRDRRRRVDPARGHPGPAVPRRGRPAAPPAVRHRAGGTAPRAARGSASPRWSSTSSASRLEKGHSAVDWSTRPLPEPWLRYAALDVEVLVELRDLMGVELASQGKPEWARQEFEALAAHRTAAPSASTRGGAPPA